MQQNTISRKPYHNDDWASQLAETDVAELVGTHTSDLLKLPEPAMLVEGLLPAKSIVGLSALPGVGKSWTSLDIARAVAEGTTVLGKRATNIYGYISPEDHQGAPKRVLYIAADSSEHDYARQLRRLLHKWEAPTPEMDDEGVVDLIGWQQAYELHGHEFDLLDKRIEFIFYPELLLEEPASVLKIIKKVAELEQEGDQDGDVPPEPVGLIVIDTFQKLTRCTMLDYDKISQVFRNLRLITEVTEATILLLHHNSYGNEHNDGERWFGSVGGPGGLDVQWQLRRADKRDASKLELVCKKFRGITPAPTRFTLDVFRDENTADLIAETDTERATRLTSEARKAVEREQQKEAAEREVLNRLRSLGEHFSRSSAEPILKQHLPGWAKKSGSTLKNRTRDWLAAHPMIDSAEDGKALTYTVRADGNGGGEDA